MPSFDSLLSALLSTWRMWALVIGGLVFFRVCRIVYRIQQRLKRGY